MPRRSFVAVPALLFLAAACGRFEDVGRAPAFSSIDQSSEARAMSTPGLPRSIPPTRQADEASLWSGSRSSLLGDQRASTRGDILTVVIEIDDSAEISNSSSRARSASESMGVDALFGLPQRLDERLPGGASTADAVRLDSASGSSGDGSVRRNEQLELRIAATVVDELGNGVLRIEGSQEVLVNYEMRELLVTGFVRPEDISRQNEITYDKIASARISYGGRGYISNAQRPRYGQRIADIILPF